MVCEEDGWKPVCKCCW